MAVALAIFGVAFAAFCVWLTVRIVNRRERWAKWTLAAVVGLPAIYVLGLGPACWVSSRTNTGTSIVSAVYRPVLRQVRIPSATASLIDWYSRLGANAGWMWSCAHNSDNWKWQNVDV